MFKKKVHNTVIEVVDGDITEMDVDAIVNAANSKLKHGGGVASAIVKKGGHTIQEESDVWVKAWGGEVTVGSAVITSGGKLPAKYVIHAVGPRMGEGDEDEKLKNATINSLKLMDEHKLRTIAFPAISTGIFGFPIDRCAEIMISTASEYLAGETQIEEVIFCLFTAEDFEVFEKALK